MTWDHECRELETGRLVERFESWGLRGWKTLGDFQVVGEVRERFWRLLLLSWLAVREKGLRIAVAIGAGAVN